MTNVHGRVLRRWGAPRVRTSWWARLGVAVAAASSIVVAAGPPGAAAQVPPSTAFFVGTDGTVATYGQAADGSRSNAVALTPSGIAPAGTPVATARIPNGAAIVAVVGKDGALNVGSCPANPTGLSPVTGPGIAGAGAPVAVAVGGGHVWLGVEDKPHSLIMNVEEASNPCGPFPIPLPHVTATWLATGAAITATGLADGRVGVFSVDTAGAVHALWVSPNGQATSSTLTPAGTATPGSGIAVTPASGASATPGALSLFYTGHDGRIYLAHPVPGGGLTGDPEPHPWAPTASQNGPPLAAATGPLGTVVSYVATDGTVTADLVDPNGQWQATIAATGPGFAAAGASTGVIYNATEVDIYCGNSSGRPGTIVVNPHVGGPGTWFPSGPPNKVGATTSFAAS